MPWTRLIGRALLVVALGAYAADCEAMTTPEQAMQCCSAMHCASQGHQGMDCCKRMPKADPAFVLPGLVHAAHLDAVAGLLPVGSPSPKIASAPVGVSARSHAPPEFSPPLLLPLRI